MLQKWKIGLCCFPYGGSQRAELTPWAMSAAVWASKQKDIDGGLWYMQLNDTPTPMCRNAAVQGAIERGLDILVMVDSDMGPDIDRSHPFLPSAFAFIKSRWHSAPTIISAPYCTAGPAYLPVMGTWRTFKDGFPIKTDLYTREEAAGFHGIQACSLQGTGLMALDLRLFTGFEVGGETVKLPPPWFEYEYADAYRTQKVTTEDMFFARNAALLFAKYGLTIGYVDWDAWATHFKTEAIGKPQAIDVVTVAQYHREITHEDSQPT